MFAGDFVFGSHKSDCTDVRIEEMSYTGDHIFYKMSRQIEPSLYMFGWYIFVRNFTFGGLLG